jgi:hypothetical protein
MDVFTGLGLLIYNLLQRITMRTHIKPSIVIQVLIGEIYVKPPANPLMAAIKKR